MSEMTAIVGATGAVGREMIRILEQRGVAPDDLVLLASSRSAGARVEYGGGALTVQPLEEAALRGVKVALFAADRETARQYAPIAVAGGAVVIDNSSQFRMDPGVPLIVPEVNPQDLTGYRGIIANPNCTTIILAMALWPLHRVNPIQRVVVSTYQAASGAGQAAMDELTQQTRAVLDGRPAEPRVFPHPIAFNLFCHDSAIGPEGYNEEEMKVRAELRKIFGAAELPVTATCVRVPVLRAHSESVNVTFDRPMSAAQVREVLAGAPGVRVVDDRAQNRFPMPVEASGIDEVLVGRIRADLSQPDGRGIELFLSGDQLRKGAALNAIQIADLLSSKLSQG